ncbi:Putative ABC transporter [Acididesulfobacillus acetoxydans]|uniref:ABC transporter n=2 Tax=Acididesulfobacillus acetoxydans TaxID=1561005 RepID=A0A8S0WWZ0_9FIRM|nr:Putative ABC transporter [Acididesulfobacillus acetoxydans]CEJ09392.1 High-affinity branched-chain amino acid transport ATP-binding protein LivF [Acididesulfobacillus acetoxydans]
MKGIGEMLNVENMVVSYGNIRAVREVSLTVGDGEFVVLIGNNGAGKTSTLKAICGVNSPSGGTVNLNGENITGKPSHKIAAKRVAMVPEGRRVFAGMTVRENLDMGAFLRRDKKSIENDRETVYELFPVLRERFRQPAGTLSGGEQQMLAIGRALMAQPQYLLLDEPSLGLAPIMVESIFEKIVQINRQGISLLMVEQNAFLALSVANRGYVMDSGEIVLAGTAEELLENDMVKRVYLGMEEAEES